MQAQLEFSRCTSLNGANYIIQTKRAIHYLLEALSIATAKENQSQYGFIVYNTSVHYWRISRPLMRDASYRYLVESMGQILEALVANDDPDKSWIVRYLLSLTHAHVDANEPGKAAKRITEAHQMVSSLFAADEDNKELKDLFNEVLLLEVHMGAIKNPECQKLNDAAKKMMSSDEKQFAMYKIQCVKSGLTPHDKAKSELESIFREVVPEAYETPTEDESIPKQVVHLEAVVEIGLLSMVLGFIDLAQRCETVANRSKGGEPLLRLQRDLLKCFLLAQELSGTGNSEKTKKLNSRRREAMRLARRADALKTMERILTATKRLGDPDMLHRGCIIAWNLGLPLLQPHLRRHLHRLFLTAVTILDDLESPLLQLRSQLHLEVAKCEISSDFLTKAMIHVRKALEMDYGRIDIPEGLDNLQLIKEDDLPEAEQENKNDDRRPLDRFLRPLHNKLDLKLNLYKEPDSPEEKALMLIEQSLDANESTLKASLLDKAARMLEESEPEEVEESMAEPDPIQKKRAALWNDIARYAWRMKLVPLTQKATKRVCNVEWDPVRYKDYCVLQTEAWFILAETYVESAKAFQVESEMDSDPRLLGVAVPLKKKDLEGIEKDLLTIKTNVIESFLLGLRSGLKLNSSWLVENAMIYLWNYHLHIVKDPNIQTQIMPELQAALEEGLSALHQIESKDMDLVCNLSQVVSHLAEISENWAEAEKICDAVIAKASTAQAKALIECKGRVVLKKTGKEPDLGPKLENKVLGWLQFVESDSGTEDARETLLIKAIEAWTTGCAENKTTVEDSTLEEDENQLQLVTELWVRLGRVALDLKNGDLVKKCSRSALQTVPETPEDRNAVPSKLWRWYSLAESIWSQSILQLITHDGNQEKSMQDTIRLESANHLCIAAKFAAWGGNAALVIDAAKVMWNATLSMMNSDVTRRLLFKPLRSMLDELANVGDTSELEFRVTLYCLLFEIYFDEERWHDGIESVEEAFQQIPQALQKPLWKYRVIFMSKLGKSVQEGLSKMKESDNALQAKVWATVARSSTDLGAQFMAYSNALETLSGDFQRVDFLIEFGEWFLSNNFPLKDVLDVLHLAMDILVQIYNTSDPNDVAEDPLDEEMSDAMSKIGSIAKTHATAIKRRQSGTSKATSMTSASGKEIESQITLDISHLERLVRICIMLGTCAATYPERINYFLLAYSYIRQIWEMAIETANVAEIHDRFAKQEDSEEVDFESWTKEQPRSFSVPMTFQEWASFNFTPELTEFLSKPTEGYLKKGMTEVTFDKAPLTIYYLMQLVDAFVEYGYHLYCLPILSLATILSKVVVQPNIEPLLSYLHVKTSRILDRLNYAEESQAHLQLAGYLGTTSDEMQCFIEEVQLREEQASNVLGSEPQAGREVEEGLVLARQQKAIGGFNVREIWAKKCELVIELGLHRQAKELLLAADRHNAAFKDVANTAYCNVLRGVIFEQEGNVVGAVSHFLQSISVSDLNVTNWTDFSIKLIETLRKNQMLSKAADISAQCVQVLSTMRMVPAHPVAIKTSHGKVKTEYPDKDVTKCIARSEMEFGLVLVQQCLENNSIGRPWNEHWSKADRLFRSAFTTIKTLGQCPLMITILESHADSILRVQFTLDEFHLKDQSELLDQMEDLLTRAVEISKSILETASPLINAGSMVPLEIVLSRLQYKLGLVEYSRWEEASENRMIYYQVLSNTTNSIVDKWLEKTAPKSEPTIEEMKMPPIERAQVYFSGALQQSLPTLSSLYEANVAAAMREKAETIESVSEMLWQYASPELKTSGISSAISKEPEVSEATDEAPAPDPVSIPLQLEVATQRLKQSLDRAIDLKNRDALERSTLSLMLSSACMNPVEATKYLLWYQSCVVSKHLQNIFESACASDNRQSLFIQRLEYLKQTVLLPAATNSQYKACEYYLETESIIWKRLSTTTRIDQVFETLTAPLQLLCLQFSHDKRYLYTACQSTRTVFSRMEFPHKSRQRLMDLLKKRDEFLQPSTAVRSYSDRYGESGDLDNQDNEDTMQQSFSELLEDLRTIFEPLLQSIELKQVLEGEDKAWTLLLDPILHSLPFEALLTNLYGQGSYARDFSIHMMYHRKCSLTTPTLVNTSMSYIADPSQEDTSEESVLKTIDELTSSKVIDKWTGIRGDDYLADSLAWQKLLTNRGDKGGFMYYGPGRALSWMEPQFLAGLDVTGCQLVVLLDRADNDLSSRSQSQKDNRKSFQVLQHEGPYNTAALFTLAGVNSIVMNQWYTGLHSNRRFVRDWLKGFKGSGKSLSQSISDQQGEKLKARILYNPCIYGLGHSIELGKS